MFFDVTTKGFHMFHLLLLLECVIYTEHDMPCALGGDFSGFQQEPVESCSLTTND